MPEPFRKSNRHFTEAALRAARAARAAKRAEADHFGEPELYITRAGDKAFTWELRRFGGVVLQRGEEPFITRAEAEAAGAAALSTMKQHPDLPKFKRQNDGVCQSRLGN